MSAISDSAVCIEVLSCGCRPLLQRLLLSAHRAVQCETYQSRCLMLPFACVLWHHLALVLLLAFSQVPAFETLAIRASVTFAELLEHLQGSVADLCRAFG